MSKDQPSASSNQRVVDTKNNYSAISEGPKAEQTNSDAKSVETPKRGNKLIEKLLNRVKEINGIVKQQKEALERLVVVTQGRLKNQNVANNRENKDNPK
jgi:hypothetical protein